MSQWVWLDRAVIVAIHEMQLAEHGGGVGVRDAGLLDSALGKPLHLSHYGEPPPDVAALAASYGYGISRNHPFVDGNKRVGAVAALVFLDLNGVTLALDETPFEALVMDVAGGQQDKAAVITFLRRGVVP